MKLGTFRTETLEYIVNHHFMMASPIGKAIFVGLKRNEQVSRTYIPLSYIGVCYYYHLYGQYNETILYTSFWLLCRLIVIIILFIGILTISLHNILY